MSEHSPTSPSEVVVAFSTLPDTRPLYKRDAFNLLALPDGFRIRWSYRDKWIWGSRHKDASGGEAAETFFADLEAGNLSGKTALLVLCGNYDDVDERFHAVTPVRWARIAETRKSSLDRTETTFHVSFVLGERVAATQLAVFEDDEALRAIVPSATTGAYLQSANLEGLASPTGEDGIAWNELVARLRRIEPIDEGLLFQLLSLRRHGAKIPRAREWLARWWEAKCPSWIRCMDGKVGGKVGAFARSGPKRFPVSVSSVGTNQVTLVSGRLYEMDLYVHKDSAASWPAPVDLSIQGDHLAIAEPLVRQHGSGALMTYLLAVERKYAAEFSTLLLRPSVADLDGPLVQLLVRMGPARYFWPLTLTLLVVGWGFARAIPAVLEDPCQGEACTKIVIRLGVELVGAALIAFTSWYALRKLPTKL